AVGFRFLEEEEGSCGERSRSVAERVWEWLDLRFPVMTVYIAREASKVPPYSITEFICFTPSFYLLLLFFPSSFFLFFFVFLFRTSLRVLLCLYYGFLSAAMEEGLRGDVCGASTSCGEMEASVRRTHVPGYIHGLAARGVHYLHRPGPTLQDLGYMILPWTFHPFVYHSKRFYTVLLWLRILAFLVVRLYTVNLVVFFIDKKLPGVLFFLVQ
ncbi:hypothetical protein BHE74_00014291, partial [Ensete ventricosum]